MTSQKKWKKLMREEPAALDLKALESEFYARPDHAHLKSLRTLHEEAQQLLYRTLEELRAFVMAKDDEVSVQQNRMQRGFVYSQLFSK